MSRMPPSLSGGLLCASAAVTDIANTAATMPVVALFTEASLLTRHIACGFEIFGAIMPHGVMGGKAKRKAASAVFSAKRNDPVGWVERSETHQSLRGRMMAIAALHRPLDWSCRSRRARAASIH